MDLFDEDSDDGGDSGVLAQETRPVACGVMRFHAGIETQMLQHVLDTTPRNDAPAALAAIDRFCWSRHWMMHLGDAKAGILRKALATVDRPFRGCEIGTYCGYSAVLTASLLTTGDSLLSLETDEEACGWARRLISHCGLSAMVTVVHVATSAADAAREHGGVFNYLLIDHAKQLYLNDLKAFEPLLAPGCVVVADNILCFDGGDLLAPYLGHVRNKAKYSASNLHAALVEYTDANDGEADGVEVSVFRGSEAA
ncbi:S-adenosyl-L-methionine-dependent methyltransferase [Pelagophyceae sp. CCMP2097]|nr:S-adenosyl-L-methionine-dependent methyltransferase [Pelagophyceae sp. CCMP2097]